MGKLFRLCCSSAWIALVLAPWPTRAADPDLPRYHASTSEVRLVFSALDRNGHAIATLKEGDFAVVDSDLIVRRWRSFARTDFTRLQITVALDASASTQSQFQDEIAGALRLLDSSQGIPEENLSILVFQGKSPELLCSGNCRSLRRILRESARSEGLTPLFDSLVYAAAVSGRSTAENTKRVLLLLSDGEDTISRAAFGDAVESLRRNEVEVYALDTGGLNSGGATILKRLADETGGRYLRLAEAGAAMDAVLEDFHATYIVTYELPARINGYHPVRILPTRDATLSFRSASGYYYSASQ